MFHPKDGTTIMKYLIRLKVHDFLIKSNRTELRTYKVEERTFGSPVYFQWLEEYSFVHIKLEENSLMALVAILTETNDYVT